MRFFKMIGAVVMVATTTLVLFGIGTASAQTHKIVLCKELVILCAPGKLWPSLSRFTWLAGKVEFSNSLGTITCEDSTITGELEAEIGDPLPIKNAALAFGVLPTPKLGLGCTGPCTGAGAENFHATLEGLRYLVEAPDRYFILGGGLALILNCPLVGTCVYRTDHFKDEIKHNGTHPSHPNANNLPLTLLTLVMNRQTTHAGSTFCPATTVWAANYIHYLAEAGGVPGLAWPSLDK